MLTFKKTDDNGWPFKLMLVGESCRVTGRSAVKIQREAHKYAHKVGKKVSCTSDVDGVIVTRIS